MRYTKKEETEKTVEKEKFDLPECFVLWRHESKNKNFYMTGHDCNGNKIVGFIKEHSAEKEPTVRIYEQKEDNKLGEEIIVLWENVSKADNKYLSGYTNEKEKVIAFYGDEKVAERPYIKGYFKVDEK